jgi:FkbM family methyltransferase
MSTQKTMSLRSVVTKLVEHLTGPQGHRAMPRGMDVVRDLANSLPRYRVEVVFDIGANVGQSAKVFLARFPSSHVYCFEPVSHTFRQLQDNLRENERVDCHRLAFGSSRRTGKMVLGDNSEMCFLLNQPTESPTSNDVPTESVEVVTLDEFCQTQAIARISYLKIDTEGGDLDVLKGAVNMLTEQRIDLVEVEAGMNPGNRRHVPFESLKAWFESHGYFLFGIYEQMDEWPTREPHLRRTNPIFTSRRLIVMNRHSTGACA